MDFREPVGAVLDVQLAVLVYLCLLVFLRSRNASFAEVVVTIPEFFVTLVIASFVGRALVRLAINELVPAVFSVILLFL